MKPSHNLCVHMERSYMGIGMLIKLRTKGLDTQSALSTILVSQGVMNLVVGQSSAVTACMPQNTGK